MQLFNIFLSLPLLLLIGFTAEARKETRDLDSFNRISLAVPAQVYLEQGSGQFFEIEGDDEMLDHLLTEVSGGELHIKMEKQWQNRNWRHKPTIRIRVPELYALKVTGSGSIESRSTFSSESMDVAVTGSGKLQLPLEAAELRVNITGSGTAQLSGNANTATVKITGSGKLDAEELVARECDIRISGSGSCQIHSANSLEARISGSGKIYYSGSPKHVNVQSTGSGKAVKRG